MCAARGPSWASAAWDRERGVRGGRHRGQIQQGFAEHGVVALVRAPEGAEQVLVQEAVAEPGERPALVAQDVHGDGPPTVYVADDAVGGDLDLVEGDLGQLVGAVRLLDRPHLDAGGPEVHDEGGEPAVS